MTLYQKINYLFIKLRYRLYQSSQEYEICIGQKLLIITLGDEKLKGKIKSIDKVESDGTFITNVYEIQGDTESYYIDDCHILCVFNTK